MKKKIKLINDAFEALSHVFYSEMRNHAEALLAECVAEEKGHRGWGPDFAKHHTSDTISIKQAGKLFAVHRVAQYLNGDKYPVGKDYLHTQRSCFTAAAIADEYGSKVREAWAGFNLQDLVDLDYCEFVKVKNDTTTEAA